MLVCPSVYYSASSIRRFVITFRFGLCRPVAELRSGVARKERKDKSMPIFDQKSVSRLAGRGNFHLWVAASPSLSPRRQILSIMQSLSQFFKGSTWKHCYLSSLSEEGVRQIQSKHKWCYDTVSIYMFAQ